jgi:hypothetical protein
MTKMFKVLVPSSFKDYFKEISARLYKLEAKEQTLATKVRHLEVAVDTLIESPTYTAASDVGFNGQAARKEIFNELIQTIDFQCIFETGTWIGNTTGYMSEQAKIPVFTTEISRRYHCLAKMRLSGFNNVTLENLDSREFIRKLADDPGLRKARAFFYLDAHWYESLPLKEEIELITQHWDQFVIMVDDFEVADDKGYGYDNYGRDKALTIEHIRPLLERHDLVPFAPRKSSDEETGRKRGCVVITRRGDLSGKLEKASTLRMYPV